MPKSTNQKAKLLLIERFFTENTDENHGVTVSEILDMLAANGITADRKTIYDDIETLNYYGIEIISERDGRRTVYKYVSRDFALAELKLLVDSVVSAKFISESQSRELLKKIGHLASRHEALELRRSAILSGRVKTMNDSVIYNVDPLHQAIADGCPVTFTYWQWNVKKEQQLRHDGERYTQLPLALLWDDENYYLIATDPATGMRKHFRVDKMKDIRLLPADSWPEEFPKQADDLPKYSKSLFGMFGGAPVNVTLVCANGLIGPILDRFGKETPISVVDATHFRAHVTVAASDQFYGWLIGLGEDIYIESPEPAAERMREITARLARQYCKK